MKTGTLSEITVKDLIGLSRSHSVAQISISCSLLRGLLGRNTSLSLSLVFPSGVKASDLHNHSIDLQPKHGMALIRAALCDEWLHSVLIYFQLLFPCALATDLLHRQALPAELSSQAHECLPVISSAVTSLLSTSFFAINPLPPRRFNGRTARYASLSLRFLKITLLLDGIRTIIPVNGLAQRTKTALQRKLTMSRTYSACLLACLLDRTTLKINPPIF